jgi:YHS domain-containing protein
MGRLKIAFPYLLFALMIGLVIWSNLRERSSSPVNYAEAVKTMAALGDGSVATQMPADPTLCQHCGKTISSTDAVPVAPSGSTFRFCSTDCKDTYLKEQINRRVKKKSSRIIDPVCGMEVNPTWGINFSYEGTKFHFCTEMCRNVFAADPLPYIGERCMVCRKPLVLSKAFPATYLGETYFLCSTDHRKEFKGDAAKFFMHRMWGIPNWLYYISIALVLLVSFLMFEGLNALQKRHGHSATDKKLDAPQHDRIDLMQFGIVRTLLRSRPFRFFLQFSIVVAFLLIIAAGLFGNQNPALNIAPILTWTIWWCGLVVLIMFVGKAWCYMCPWDAIAFWIEKLRFWKKTDSGLGLNIPWPRVIQNIALATILFVALTWIELGFNVTMRPVFTAYLGIAMLLLAIVSAFIFERKSFCRYGCLVGRVSGLYALFSGIEVRRKNEAVCKSCKGKECYNGSTNAYGCPTFEFPAQMVTNTYCTQCSECLQSCPYNNLAVNLRPWGEDLKVEGKSRTDEAYMALLMLAITSFHGLTMTPVWAQLTEALDSLLSMGRIVAFSTGMAIIMGLPILLYAFFVWLSRLLDSTSTPDVIKRLSYKEYFVRYAYCLLPIALFYHLAHNLEHLLMEGPKVFALISDPLGWGWNLFSTAGISIPPLTSLDVLWILQVILVGVGHVYSLWAAQKISRHIFTSDTAASRGQWPMLAAMIAFSIFSLWLLKQPMEMRTSAM